MKKRFSFIFILLAFVFTISSITTATRPKVFADVVNLQTKCKSALLIDADSNTVIFNHNEEERLPIASMCKIMTLLLCFEAIDNDKIKIDDVVVISENASGMGGSQVFLETNGEYIVGELIKGITVASANDACVAMAETICGSESSFVDLMNERAQQLGMNNTNFTNCTGLPKVGQYSCAKDVATMFSELIKHEEYFRFSKIWTDIISHPKDRITEISNTNKLIRFYEGCDSGKTGYTSEAGHCLVASAKRNDMRLISVVISAPDSKTRFGEVSSMFNYGFANYTNKLVVDKDKPLDLSVEIENGKCDKLEVVAEQSFYLFSLKTQKRSVEIDFEPLSKVKAPIEKGEKVGILQIYEDNKLITSINVLANENVLAKTYFDRIIDISNNWALI